RGWHHEYSSCGGVTSRTTDAERRSSHQTTVVNPTPPRKVKFISRASSRGRRTSRVKPARRQSRRERSANVDQESDTWLMREWWLLSISAPVPTAGSTVSG